MSTTFYEPTIRRPFFRDRRGIVTFEKREDEILSHAVDFTDALESGETVSSVTYEENGVTISGGSLATPVYSYTITGTGGYILIKATTSTSREIHRIIQYSDPLGVANDDDYGNI